MAVQGCLSGIEYYSVHINYTTPMDYSDIKTQDPQVYEIIKREEATAERRHRAHRERELCFAAVLEAMGSVLTNKYSEGYPGKRYYGGNEIIDQAETLAIDRAKQLFGAEHVNVQPLSRIAARTWPSTWRSCSRAIKCSASPLTRAVIFRTATR